MKFTLRRKPDPTPDVELDQNARQEKESNTFANSETHTDANREPNLNPSAEAADNDRVSGKLSDRTDPTLVDTNAENTDAERRRDIDTTEKPDGHHPHGLHGEELNDFPTLNYGITHRKRRTKIAFYFTLLFVESCLLPEALFYGLTFGVPGFKLQDTFAIITALCGTFSPIKFFLGMFKLWRKKTTDKCRPLGQENRLGFDFTHIVVTAGYWIFIIILIIGTAPHEQITPLIAMAAPGFVFWMGSVMLYLQILHHMGRTAPFRISSVAKGSRVPAAVYPLIEDICAVEGHGNREFRERLKARYEASPVFRQMLDQVSWFWIFGAFMTVAASAACVGTLKWYVGYGVGFGLPFVWGYLWGGITILHVSRMLKKEKATWSTITKP